MDALHVGKKNLKIDCRLSFLEDGPEASVSIVSMFYSNDRKIYEEVHIDLCMWIVANEAT